MIPTKLKSTITFKCLHLLHLMKNDTTDFNTTLCKKALSIHIFNTNTLQD